MSNWKDGGLLPVSSLLCFKEAFMGKKMDFGTKGWCPWCKRAVGKGGVRKKGKLYHKACLKKLEKFYPK